MWPDTADGTLTVAPSSTGHGRELRLRTEGNGHAFLVLPAFDKLKIGWQLYQADPSPSSYDLRLDDIAVSTRRVGGCGG